MRSDQYRGCNLNSTVEIESFCLGTVVESTHLEQICTSHIGNYEQKHRFVVIIKQEETTENLRIKVQVNLCTKHEIFWMSFPNIYDISCMWFLSRNYPGLRCAPVNDQKKLSLNIKTAFILRPTFGPQICPTMKKERRSLSAKKKYGYSYYKLEPPKK